MLIINGTAIEVEEGLRFAKVGDQTYQLTAAAEVQEGCAVHSAPARRGNRPAASQRTSCGMPRNSSFARSLRSASLPREKQLPRPYALRPRARAGRMTTIAG